MGTVTEGRDGAVIGAKAHAVRWLQVHRAATQRLQGPVYTLTRARRLHLRRERKEQHSHSRDRFYKDKSPRFRLPFCGLSFTSVGNGWMPLFALRA